MTRTIRLGQFTTTRMTYRELQERPGGILELEEQKRTDDTAATILVAAGGILTPAGSVLTAYTVYQDVWWYTPSALLTLFAALLATWLGTKALRGWCQKLSELEKHPERMSNAVRHDVLAAAIAAEDHYHVRGLQTSDVPLVVGVPQETTVVQQGKKIAVTAVYPNADSPLQLLVKSDEDGPVEVPVRTEEYKVHIPG